MPALEPGSKGDGWIKPPIDLSQRFQLKDVHQGAADDCWFNAGIGAIAGTRPGFLEKNIRQNPNGTYTVTFYKDDKPFETTVSGYLPYQNFKGRKIPYYSYGEDGQENKGWNWASVFEKARAAQPGSGTYDSLSGFSSAFGNKGVAPEGALELLTGQDADTIIVNDPAHGNHLAPLSPTEEQLKKAIDDHQPIAATRYTDGFPWDQNPGNPALVPYHVYIVTGVQNGKVTLANPWGPDGGNLKGTKIEGTVTISIDEFRSRFRDLAIGAKP
nr:C2 family cysteine protease [Psychromicrobium silvestre]